MIPLLRMLESQGLSLQDAEGAGGKLLGDAVRRCQYCLDIDTCIRWLKWDGRQGPSPVCTNMRYFEMLKARGAH